MLQRLDEMKEWLTEHVENQFSKKFTAIVATIIGAILLVAGALKFVEGSDVGAGLTITIFCGAGAAVLLIVWIIGHRFK